MVDESLGLPDSRWLKRALTFNFHPVAYLHDSWFDTLPYGDLMRRLRTMPRAAPQVSRHLLQALGLEQDYWYDFSDRRTRLALLNGPTLERLFLYLGLTLRSTELRGELLGERLRPIKQAVGEDGFAFAVKRAPFLGGLPDFSFEPETDDPHTRFSLIGARFCADQLPAEALLKRMALKLPVAWSSLLTANPQPSPVTIDPSLPPLLRKLIKELMPKWTPLFA
ncbi:MAG: SctK family type III secretion system sorting platform protein [Candidatus Competibacteraceae bacterium]|nr:SctK family type III secretion system sorting platform protein [Candidatus Competibacteraceae bacterium]